MLLRRMAIVLSALTTFITLTTLPTYAYATDCHQLLSEDDQIEVALLIRRYLNLDYELTRETETFRNLVSEKTQLKGKLDFQQMRKIDHKLLEAAMLIDEKKVALARLNRSIESEIKKALKNSPIPKKGSKEPNLRELMSMAEILDTHDKNVIAFVNFYSIFFTNEYLRKDAAAQNLDQEKSRSLFGKTYEHLSGNLHDLLTSRELPTEETDEIALKEFVQYMEEVRDGKENFDIRTFNQMSLKVKNFSIKTENKILDRVKEIRTGFEMTFRRPPSGP